MMKPLIRGSLNVMKWALAGVGVLALLLTALVATPLTRPAELQSISAVRGTVDFSALPAVERFQARDGTALGFRHYPAGGPASTEEPLWKRVGANPERFFLMFGRQDKPTTAEQCELFLKQYPTYPLMLLDGCSHMVHWDYADEFERQAIAFAKASPVAA